MVFNTVSKVYFLKQSTSLNWQSLLGKVMFVPRLITHSLLPLVPLHTSTRHYLHLTWSFHSVDYVTFMRRWIPFKRLACIDLATVFCPLLQLSTRTYSFLKTLWKVTFVWLWNPWDGTSSMNSQRSCLSLGTLKRTYGLPFPRKRRVGSGLLLLVAVEKVPRVAITRTIFFISRD